MPANGVWGKAHTDSFWEQPGTVLLGRVGKQSVDAVLCPSFQVGHLGRFDVQNCRAAYGKPAVVLLKAVESSAESQRW